MPTNLFLFYYFSSKYSLSVAKDYLSRGIIDESTTYIEFLLPSKVYRFSKVDKEVKIFIDGESYLVIQG